MLSLNQLLEGDSSSDADDDGEKPFGTPAGPASSFGTPATRSLPAAASTIPAAGLSTPKSPVGGLATNSGLSIASSRTEESKKRLERLRQQQAEREAQVQSTYMGMKEVPGVPSLIASASAAPLIPPSVATAGAAKPSRAARRHSDDESSLSSESPPRRRRGGSRRRRGSDAADEDSLEEWGVMVADRGTQTWEGVNADTQTDPHPHVIACKECYKNHFGRDVDTAALGSGCEHGVSDLTSGITASGGPLLHPSLNVYSDPTSQQYLQDILPSLGGVDPSAPLPPSSQWKLQLSKIRYMFDRTMTTLAPNVQAAQTILAAKGHSEAAAAAPQPPAPAAAGGAAAGGGTGGQEEGELSALRRELAELKEAYVRLAEAQHSAGGAAAAPAAAAPGGVQGGVAEGGQQVGVGVATPAVNPVYPQQQHQQQQPAPAYGQYPGYPMYPGGAVPYGYGYQPYGMPVQYPVGAWYPQGSYTDSQSVAAGETRRDAG